MSIQLDVAAALFAAIEGKDPEGVAALYSDDIEVWHNFSNACQDKATNLGVLAALCANVPEVRYEVTERMLLEDGRVMQRHLLRARVGEEEIVIPACIFLAIEDGRIRRIDEYLDTGQANRLRAATGREPVAS
jgi:ketosteroid isomerase-like protein